MILFGKSKGMILRCSEYLGEAAEDDTDDEVGDITVQGVGGLTLDVDFDNG